MFVYKSTLLWWTINFLCPCSFSCIVSQIMFSNTCFLYFCQGAAFVEFDVHLSKDFVPVVYHDLTCCLTMKKVCWNSFIKQSWPVHFLVKLLLIPSFLKLLQHWESEETGMLCPGLGLSIAELAFHVIWLKDSPGGLCISLPLSLFWGRRGNYQSICFLGSLLFQLMKPFLKWIDGYDLAKVGRATIKNKIENVLWSQIVEGLTEVV